MVLPLPASLVCPEKSKETERGGLGCLWEGYQPLTAGPAASGLRFLSPPHASKASGSPRQTSLKEVEEQHKTHVVTRGASSLGNGGT